MATILVITPAQKKAWRALRLAKTRALQAALDPRVYPGKAVPPMERM
jgi:hypothetical protein